MLNRLTQKSFEALEAKDHNCGRGLYLRKSKTGSASWLYRFREDKPEGGQRSTSVSFGSFPDLDLDQAHGRVAELRNLQAAGVDLRVHLCGGGSGDQAITENVTVRQMAEYVRDKMKAEDESKGRKGRYPDVVFNNLSRYVFPRLGDMRLLDIKQSDLRELLRQKVKTKEGEIVQLWHGRAVSAKKLIGQIAKLYQEARILQVIDKDFQFPTEFLLEAMGPQTHKEKAHASLPYEQAPEFYAAIGERAGTAADCLRLIMLTLGRSNEIRGLRHDEIDRSGEIAVMTIPGSRTKTGKEHRVTLSKAALEIIDAQPREKGQELVFIGDYGDKVLSVNAFVPAFNALQSQGFTADDGSRLTAHGFRSTFKRWATKETIYQDELSEMVLAHVSNKVREAYARGEIPETQMNALLTLWANYLLCDVPLEALRVAMKQVVELDFTQLVAQAGS